MAGPTTPTGGTSGASPGSSGGPGLIRPTGRIGVDQGRVALLARDAQVSPGNAVMSAASLEIVEGKFPDVFPGATGADRDNLRADILTDIFLNGGAPSFHNDPKSPPIVYVDPNGNKAYAERVATYQHLFGNEAMTTGGGMRKYCKSYPKQMLGIMSNPAIQERMYEAGITIHDRLELFGMAQAKQLVTEAEEIKKRRVAEARETSILE